MTTHARPFDISVRAMPSSVRDAREAAAEAARELGVPKGVVDDIRLCVSETVTNVVRHAYVGEVGYVHITLERLGRGVRVVVRDFGSGVATIGRTRPRDAGGLGWKIVRSLADRFAVKSSFAEGTEVSMSFGTLLPADRAS